ncbi:hypothetical protein [Persicitalea jodogahamensis]|uniref:hypothetical protein n=1 Tax=Persicitalea jodogahamensis TaxID=402147 RepID=UPI001675D02E|nr:hypothetical protein [Persicitalea jodogahamensis]
MNRFIQFVCLVFAFSFCKTQNDPLPEVANIVGKWLLVESAYTRNDSTITEQVPGKDAHTIAFRYDGVLLDRDGQRSCCGPSSYFLNGILFEVKTNEVLPGKCAAVSCLACPRWELVQQGDSLTITACQDVRLRYIRQ